MRYYSVYTLFWDTPYLVNLVINEVFRFTPSILSILDIGIILKNISYSTGK